MLEKVPLVYAAYNPSGYKTKTSSSVSLAMLNSFMVGFVDLPEVKHAVCHVVCGKGLEGQVVGLSVATNILKKINS